MPIDKEKVRQALRELSKADLSSKEKLRRIDVFLSQIKRTKWDLVFSIIKEENLRLGIFTLKDLFILFLRFKDYKGLHQLKKRMYIISNRMPFLFSIRWRRFPIGVRQKNNHFYRPSKINPWPPEFYSILGKCLKKDAIWVKDIMGTTYIKRGKHFSSVAAATIEKLLAYPKVSEYLLRNIHFILKERDFVVANEAEKIEDSFTPSYRPLLLDVPDELVQALAKRSGMSYSVVEEALRVVLFCSQSEEEGKPVEMGIILASDSRVEKFLAPQFATALTQKLFLTEKDWPRIREEISRSADGKGAALIVNGSNGNLKDVRALPKNVLSDFYCHLTHPLHSDAIAFLVKQSAVRVYCDGCFKYQLILNRKYGRWGYRNLGKFCHELEEKATAKSIRPSMLSRIVNICAQISEEREGAIILVGDFKQVEPYLLPESKRRALNTRQKSIFEMTEDEMIRLLREDGAVLFDNEGQFMGSKMTFVGPGGRHKIARYITEKCSHSLSIVVSHEATITTFDTGKKWKEF